jgi:hypothetical protein
MNITTKIIQRNVFSLLMVFTLSACFEETIETQEEIIPTVKIITVRDVQETIFR